MATPAQLKANKKHLSTLDDIKIRVPKGSRDIYKAHAACKGKRLNCKLSLNELVVNFLDEDMKDEASIMGMTLENYKSYLATNFISKQGKDDI